MPRRSAGSGTSKLKSVNGKLVSARSKTGDPACSKAMSDWKTSGMTAAVAAVLGKCRAAASAAKKAASHAIAGNADKAKLWGSIAAKKAPTNHAARSAKAAELRAGRSAKAAELRAGRSASRAKPAPIVRDPRVSAHRAERRNTRLNGDMATNVANTKATRDRKRVDRQTAKDFFAAEKAAKVAPPVVAATGNRSPAQILKDIKDKHRPRAKPSAELAAKGTQLAERQPLTLKEQVAQHRAKKEYAAVRENGMAISNDPRRDRIESLARRAHERKLTARRRQLAARKSGKQDVAIKNHEKYMQNHKRMENLLVATGRWQFNSTRDQLPDPQSVSGARWMAPQAAAPKPAGPTALQSLIRSKSRAASDAGGARSARRKETLAKAAAHRETKGMPADRLARVATRLEGVKKNAKAALYDRDAAEQEKYRTELRAGLHRGEPRRETPEMQRERANLAAFKKKQANRIASAEGKASRILRVWKQLGSPKLSRT